MSKEVELKLTEDEAWVLFELVRRFSDTEKLSIEDQAEERALWNLCCVFEKSLHQLNTKIFFLNVGNGSETKILVIYMH